MVQTKVDDIFPLKSSKVPIKNKPWFTHKLRELSNKKKSVYKKEGRSDAYKALSKEFNNARKLAVNAYLDKTVDTVTRFNSPGLHKALKKLGAESGQVDKGTFNLNKHEGMSDQDIADDLGEFFSSISKEYAPLSDELLPDRVTEKLSASVNLSSIPQIEPYQVYKRIQEMNLPVSTVPGDFPPRIWKEFSVELSSPISIIVNRILRTGNWPEIFKTEWVTVIAKKTDPEDKGDLRNLSLSLFIAKLIENIIYDLLLEQFGNKIDSSQFGGRKGYSVTLYLIKMVDFILKNLDKSKAIIVSLIDFSKAYNRQCHNRLLTCYSDLGTPTYLLKVLKSYLRNRKMAVRHKNKISQIFDIPAGGAQGTNLGILSFLVYVNSCGVPFDEMMSCMEHEHKEKYIGRPEEQHKEPPINNLGWTKICHPVLPAPGAHISENHARFKYIDDLAAAEAVALSDLVPINHDMERPLAYTTGC